MGLCASTQPVQQGNLVDDMLASRPRTSQSDISQYTDSDPVTFDQETKIENKATTSINVTNSFMKRIAKQLRSGSSRAVHDFKPSINFLTIISSPTTHFDVYSRTLLTEVLRTISGQYCFLNMVDDVREQVLSCYFPNLSSAASLDSKNSAGSKRQRKPDKPVFWVTPLNKGGLVGGTCKDGHAYNLENVERHRMFQQEGDWPPGLKDVQPTSFCIQPIRYMGDETRIIGAITVVNKDRVDNSTTAAAAAAAAVPFSRRDVMQLLQICLQVSDSLYRQRIRAIESTGDSDAMSLLAHYDSEHQDQHGRRFRHHRTLKGDGKDGPGGGMETIDENKSPAKLKGIQTGETGVDGSQTGKDAVTAEMGVSPMSKHQISSARPGLQRVKTSRNEASAKDLLVYQWPLQKNGVWNKSNSTDAVVRGLPTNELGVPSDFRTLDFSALDFSAERLERFVLSIMRDTGMVDTFSIPPARLIRWTRAVRSSYQDNPFHNWYHGFSVCHFSYFQLYVSDISSFLHPIDVFGLLIAALCHDSDHPGLTNQHLMDTEDDLSIHYNDVSVLENHHAYICCELLRREETKICCYLDRRNQKELRKIVITAILHTDMSTHNKTCQKIMDRDKLRPFRSDRVTDRQTLLNICIHCSDLSAQVLPWISASRWEERISQEFNAQAIKEIELGMKPSPMMMNLDDMKVRGKGQLGKYITCYTPC